MHFVNYSTLECIIDLKGEAFFGITRNLDLFQTNPFHF